MPPGLANKWIKKSNLNLPGALKAMWMVPEELKCDPLVYGYPADGIKEMGSVYKFC